MLDQPIVMLDFETTGLSPVMGDRITEVAALRIVGGEVVERYVSLVNCNVRIPSFITGLTGITQAMVDSAPPVHRVLPELLDFIGSDALSAHNASFDEKFLLADAGVAPADVDTVFFTGGSSGVRMLRERIGALVPAARKVEGDLFGSIGAGLALDAVRKFG